MPKLVDHDSRRIELANAAARVVAKKGLERTTVRDITREAGFTPGIVAHYFRDKDDVLEHTLRLLDERTARRLVPPFDGDATLEEVLEGGMPLDDDSDIDLKARLQFYARALSTESLIEEQSKSFRVWTRAIRKFIRVRKDRGDLDAELDVNTYSDVLFSLVLGAGLIALFLPKRSRKAFSRRVLGTALQALFPDRPVTGGSR